LGYSLDLHGGTIENYALDLSPSPEEIYERKTEIDLLHIALNTLPEKQCRRIYSYFILGMTKSEISEAEGVKESSVRESITRGLDGIRNFLHKFS